ncbi:MAG: hypothetical protein ACI8PZ_000084 [Myxococcota bacterium]
MTVDVSGLPPGGELLRDSRLAQFCQNPGDSPLRIASLHQLRRTRPGACSPHQLAEHVGPRPHPAERSDPETLQRWTLDRQASILHLWRADRGLRAFVRPPHLGMGAERSGEAVKLTPGRLGQGLRQFLQPALGILAFTS